MKITIERLGHRVGDETTFIVELPESVDDVIDELKALLAALRKMAEKS